MEPKILITDGLWRKSLVAVRSLGKSEADVTVTGTNIFTTSFYSRYCRHRLLTPDPNNNPQAFAQFIIKKLQQTKYDLLIPMEDATIKALLPFRKQIEELTHFPLPATQTLEIAFDKQQTLSLARKLGIPTPIEYSNFSSAVFPVVAKLKSSSGSRGLRYLNSLSDLKKFPELENNSQNYLIQEKLPTESEEVGVNFLYNSVHQPIASFTYRRLRDYPVSGGPSTLRESTHNSQILKLGQKLLDNLSWTGVAMVEFKYDPKSKQYKLMEINPRFWGSLALPVASGINFPKLLLDMVTTKNFHPTLSYPDNIKARWLIPGDILHFLSNPNRFHLKPGFFEFFDKNTFYDDFDSSDPSGNLAVIFCTLIQALNPRLWPLVFRKNK